MSFLTAAGQGERGRALREDDGWAVTDLAVSAGLDPAVLEAVEAGRGLTVRELDALAAALGVTVDRLLIEEDTAPCRALMDGETAGRTEAALTAVVDDYFTFQAAASTGCRR